MNSRNLALRDPAAAALLGAIGADFGQDDMGYDPPGGGMYGEFGAPDFGDDMNGEFGADFGAAMARPMVPNNPAAIQRMAHEHHHMQNYMRAQRGHRNRREMMLNPNKGSDIKVEFYSFPVNTTVTIGTASTLTNMSSQPDTEIRPKRVLMNAPTVGFAFVSDIKMANVSVLVGGGASIDAYFYSAQAFGVSLDMPTLSPSNKATIVGSYTGLTPVPFVGGTLFPFCVTFQGPAMMAGGR